MEKIPSFNIDHNKLLRGVYVSRQDMVGENTLTTFDIRMKEPNREPVMNIAPMHTIEHLGATFLRNQDKEKKVIYFGPMGCRTGFYLILNGDIKSTEIVPLLSRMFEFIEAFDQKIPGTEARDCGNYLDHNLDSAKWESKKFLNEILNKIKKENLNYPE